MKSIFFSRSGLYVLILLIFPLALLAQESSIPSTFFKGYEQSLKGGGFQYHSPQPDVNSSLLVRSIDSVQNIAWETETIPADYAGKMVNLVWLFGIDANIDSHAFALYLNGKFCLSFSNPLTSEIKPWIVEGKNGCEILFRPVLLDKYGDPMGYAIMKIPSGLINKGDRQLIRIVGESKESRSWYMTFEAGIEEKLTVKQFPAIVKQKDKNAIPVLFQFVHLGEPKKGTIDIAGIPSTKFILETGFNEVKILIPEEISPIEKRAVIKIDGENPLSRNFTISPFRHFTIYLVQHTHTDIGYTRPQTEILPDHLRYIDYALDFCDQTDSLPDDARFRWSCETSWAVREYLNTRTELQTNRLKRRVNEGRIELTGLFLNGSDLADETTIAATLEPISYLRKNGFPVKSAMQSDINGVPWCLADYLPGAGIEYLNMAQNTHRAHKPFGLPTTFWWESPSGSRILVNRPEHYMWANSLGILSKTETFESGLFRHLEDITAKGYPYDRYAIQFSGYLTDNSPPSTTACKLVTEWNNTYVWPKLRLATISEFMNYMKTEHASEMQVIRGAWPDWWMDGFGSAAIPTAYARAAHSGYIANRGLMSIAALLGIPANDRINDLQSQITDDIAFYDEHTFGAAESITDPLCENSVVQLGQKESYAWSAVKKNSILREQVMGRIQPFLPRDKASSITLFNTLGWSRSGYAMVYIDHQLLPKDRKFTISDLAGTPMPMQQVSTREEGTWWMLQVTNLPALGFQTYRIQVEQEPRVITAESEFSGLLENDFYRLEVSKEKGRIVSLFDKTWNRELLDQTATYSAGEVIYERLGKNRGQLELLRLDEYTRTSWNNITIGGVVSGPVYSTLQMTGTMEGCAEGAVKLEIRLYNDQKKIEFCYSMKKLAVTDPEGVYVSFPFKLDSSYHVVQVAGGTMVPGREQIEGSSADWYGIQDFVALRSNSGQIVFVSPEIPLVQLGDINTGKFVKVANPSMKSEEKAFGQKSGSVFSWVMNNYWTTNFLASQEGELKWSYQITSGPDPSNVLATRFGMENRIPVLNRVLPAAEKATGAPIPRSFFWSGNNGVVLVCTNPAADGHSIVMQLRETSGKSDSIPVNDLILSSTILEMALNASSADEVNAAGETVRNLWEREPKVKTASNRCWISFRPFETRFIRFTLRPTP